MSPLFPLHCLCDDMVPMALQITGLVGKLAASRAFCHV